MFALSVTLRPVHFVVLAASLLSVACGADAGSPQFTPTDADEVSPDQSLAIGCEQGAVKSCTIYLGRHGDLSNCIHGLEVCADGEWSDCVDEDTMATNPDLYAALAAPEPLDG